MVSYLLILYCILKFFSHYYLLLYTVININEQRDIYEGWNFNSGNYLYTTDTK